MHAASARLAAAVALALTMFAAPGASAGAGELAVDLGGRTKTFTTEQLLARPDAATIEVPLDATYRRPMNYRAVPFRALLQGMALAPGEDVEVVARDGFVTTLPSALVFPPSGRGGSVPWLAVEPPEAPWPPAAKDLATGPFYLVWLDPEASGVRTEQWPFAVAAVRSAPSPLARWPQIAVDPAVPADSTIRAGQALFVIQCMVCHTLNGAGSAEVGPDLNLPHNPTEYLQPWALKSLIRDPGSVRRWPDMRMTGFDAAALPDADLDRVVAYLAHMAGRKAR
ncbi:MAG TPA: c-type cytochrome [Geminicoccaceae bacterium]|nr:c-type cytochrome [Geminicoccaceae bacterium]